MHPQLVVKDYALGIYARVSTNRKEQLDSLAAAHMTWFVVVTRKKD